MSNNSVHVTGYLNIQKVETLTQKGRPWPIVTGYIHTDDPTWGGTQPFVAEDGQALTIIEFARQYNLAPESQTRYGVLAHAKLVSFPHRSYLALRYISFLDTSAPVVLSPDRFAGSKVNLQGYLTIARQQYLALERQDTGLPESLLCLHASFATASAVEGGQHPVLIAGPLLQELRRSTAFQTAFRCNQNLALPATLGGKLWARGQIIYVTPDYLSADLRSRPSSSNPRPVSGGAAYATVVM